MHELSICRALLLQIHDLVEQHQACGVIEIVIGIGPLAGVESNLLARAYCIASAGTIAEHAKLTLETIPVKVICEQCGESAAVQPEALRCPKCGDLHTTLISGDELLLMSVELEQGTFAIPPNQTIH